MRLFLTSDLDRTPSSMFSWSIRWTPVCLSRKSYKQTLPMLRLESSIDAMVVLITFTLLRNTMVFYRESWLRCQTSIDYPLTVFTIFSNKCMSSFWKFKILLKTPTQYTSTLIWPGTWLDVGLISISWFYFYFRSLNAREKLREASNLSMPLSRLEVHSHTVSGARISQANDGKVRKRFLITALVFWRNGQKPDERAAHVHHIADDNRAESGRCW